VLSRTSSTSFMASPPLAASVQACPHGLKDRLGHAGGEVQCANTLSLRYLRLNRSLEAARVADAVIEAYIPPFAPFTHRIALTVEVT
jgi:hypothetical protein